MKDFRAQFLTHMISFWLLTATVAFAEPITVFWHDRAPYSYSMDNRVVGITGDRVTQVFETANIDFNWQEVPAKRQLTHIQANNAPICAAGWFKNPEREAFARFTLAIYQDKPNLLLAREDDHAVHTAERAEDLLANPDLAFLTKGGYSYGAYINDLIANAKASNLESFQQNITMARLISRRRADFMFMSAEEGAYLLEAPELEKSNLTLVEKPDLPNGNKRYIICSKSVDPSVIDRLDHAILALNLAQPDL